MPYQQIDDLPQEVKEQLPVYAQKVFLTAYNSFEENSGDKEAAYRVAWQTIEHDDDYQKGDDGKYHRIKEQGDNFSHGGVATAPNS